MISCESDVACRSAFASAYSGEAHHAFACSTLGNSTRTNRFGDQLPSIVCVFPPRTRKRPPNFSMLGGTIFL